MVTVRLKVPEPKKIAHLESQTRFFQLPFRGEPNFEQERCSCDLDILERNLDADMRLSDVKVSAYYIQAALDDPRF